MQRETKLIVFKRARTDLLERHRRVDHLCHCSRPIKGEHRNADHGNTGGHPQSATILENKIGLWWLTFHRGFPPESVVGWPASV
ncbi:hypothetical protein RMSM_05604 [Rhodopirellula maiorica SM1]|uniref:Uncharacterized protein n=1 Tax=Rhodopirellula maiorica SM1 TaxID=1265738 RepID=M5RDB3_9BACT|nr:hypothetical protein RMSM_05604 [Rhodopirellula maiorica SM1]